MLSVVLIIIGLIAALAGIVGCILPLLPGPMLSFLSLVILDLARDWQPFSLTFLLVMAAIAVGMTLLDYVVSAAGAKKYGATKFGVWGSVIGMVIGIFVFPPVGIFAGALIGAIAGELAMGKSTGQAMRVGWGVLVGNFIGAAIKLAYCLTAFFFYITKMF
ncbi:MAG: DUF456 domain-containing protein [Thermodesulfobacteriota bacterium]